MKAQYHKQVRLLLKCLPFVAKQTEFALKGGTAINLLIRDDYPRASIDIDLTYIKIQSRVDSLVGIEKGLLSIKNTLDSNLNNINILEIKNSSLGITSKLEIQFEDIAIKIEPNLILRGTVFPIQILDVSKAVEDYYGLSAKYIPVLSNSDVYAGKICAALDRQHPRDLFDIEHIIKQGIDYELKNAFLVYLISNNRPMHEILNPNLLDIQVTYTKEFLGMANIPISLDELIKNRIKLIGSINKSLSNKDKEFLISFKRGEPDYSLLPLKNIDRLPSIKWKLYNINKMNKDKKVLYLKKLEKVLGY